MPLRVGKCTIRIGKPTYIIAEIASAHCGDVKKFKKLISAAAKSGADAIKLQKFKTDELLVPSHPKYNKFKELELSDVEWCEIVKYIKKYRIPIWADVFDEKSADFMSDAGVVGFKIHSTDLTNPYLIAHVAKKKKPILLGTGGHSLEEIKKAIKVVKRYTPNVVLLHGFQGYPTRIEDTNLQNLIVLRKRFGLEVGFQDHVDAESELAIILPAVAVALGATIIEKHITLNRQERGADYYSALHPDEFQKMVQIIKSVEKALEFRVSKAELVYRNDVVKRVVAREKIKANEKIELEKIAFKRAPAGLLPIDVPKLLGKKVKRDVEKNEPITWEKIK